MNDNGKKPDSESHAGGMIRAVMALVALATLATLLLAYVDRITAEQRQRNQAAHAARVLTEVLPASLYDEPPGLESGWLADPEAPDDRVEYWPVSRDGTITGAALAVRASDGYVAPIDLLVGIARDGTVTGVRATRHRETPGLGDAVDTSRSDWILGFSGMSLEAPAAADWALRRDGGTIDQISGATVTSRAVSAAVRRALALHEANRDVIYPPGSD